MVKKIAIIGCGIETLRFAEALRAYSDKIEVIRVNVDDNMKGKSGVVILEDSDACDTKKIALSVGLLTRGVVKEHNFEELASPFDKDFYASRRYQKPTKLYGTAKHRRAANKARGKRK